MPVKSYLQQDFGSNVEFWVGTVEDRNDPLQLGRVRVRIHGHYVDDKTLIPTDTLPWAVAIQPTTTAAVSGVGQSPTGIMEGTLVLGFWLDGRDKQMPAVLGTFNTLEGGTSKNGLNKNGTNSVNDTGGKANTPGYDNPTGDGPSWLRTARGEIGVKRNKGGSHNPKILEYLKTVGLGQNENIAWCAAFAAWCLKKNNVDIKGVTGMAKSFSTASSFEKISSPLYGCIVVFNRPPKPESGHVGFYVGAEGGRIKVLGGNQGSAVSIAGFGTNNLLGYYWPKGQSKDSAKTSGSSNTNNKTTMDGNKVSLA